MASRPRKSPRRPAQFGRPIPSCSDFGLPSPALSAVKRCARR